MLQSSAHFKKFYDESRCKPNKIYVDQDIEFQNRSVKSREHNNGIETYPTHDKMKFVVLERFIIRLTTKLYKHMTTVSNHVHIDKLDEIVNKHNKTM